MNSSYAPEEYKYPTEQKITTAFSAPMLVPDDNDPSTLVVRTSVRRSA